MQEKLNVAQDRTSSLLTITSKHRDASSPPSVLRGRNQASKLAA